MKIGLVGYQGCGKSTLFHWLTGVAPDPALGHVGQSAMAVIPEPRVAQLCEIYHPKKVTLAALELVDTPGLSRAHEGNAARMAMIREAGCLVLVAGAFGGGDTMADIRSFDEDLMLADMEIVSGRIERV
ncbi:MAG: redox-regulated ATPase YchF, partial [Pirellulaceae bacterium]|nr:redox-regulated ATPase YchF [Pirellulaceae bacterium]